MTFSVLIHECLSEHWGLSPSIGPIGSLYYLSEKSKRAWQDGVDSLWSRWIHGMDS